MYTWAHDTVIVTPGQPIPLFDSCQLIITWMSYQVKHRLYVLWTHFASKCDISHPLTWVGGGMRLFCHHKISYMHIWPNFLSYGAPLRAFRSRESSARKLTLLWSLCFRRLVHSVVAPAWCRSANCHDGLSKMMLRLVKNIRKLTTRHKLI